MTDPRLVCATARRGRHRITKDEKGRPVFADASARRGVCETCGHTITRVHVSSGAWYLGQESGDVPSEAKR